MTDPETAASGREARLSLLGSEARNVIGRFDHVTRLPNRLQFIEDFETGAGWRREPGQLLVLVTLADARHFNEILRALGHAFSEEFIREGARLLESFLPPGHPLYHVSVLSFVFPWIVAGETSPPAIVSRIIARFADPVVSREVPVTTRLGIGIAELPARDGDPAEILREVLTAAQDSRATDCGWATYSRKSDVAHQRAFRILADLPAAIASEDQLDLHFQPRIDFKSGRCVGVEALLRWTHPELGPVSPGEFIPLAEQTALIAPLTDWVMVTATEQLGRWRERGLDVSVSLNASPGNLAAAGFDRHLIGMCRRAGIENSSVELEMTESTFLSHASRTRQNLENLRQAGVSVALDDFGSGFSNLAYLTQIPADILKIDQSFIRPLGTPKGSTFLVGQIVGLARGLGFRVVAEGIETPEAYQLLKEMGCDEGQGYFMSRPLPVPDFEAWYASRH